MQLLLRALAVTLALSLFHRSPDLSHAEAVGPEVDYVVELLPGEGIARVSISVSLSLIHI